MSIKTLFHKQTAFTLIEVITTIVVLSVAATAIMSMFTNTIRTSAGPMIQQQAVSIAEAYMEEILLKPFNDPDGTEVGETRATFDDVDDYRGLLDNGAKDQNGNDIVALADYTVSVTVDVTSDVNKDLNGITDALRIGVTVNHTVLGPIVLHGFRTNYQ